MITIFCLLLTAQNYLYSQSILSSRTYPYITVDDKDSIVVVFTPAQYDGLVRLRQIEKYKTLQLSTLDSAFVAQDMLIDKLNGEVLEHKQAILFNETKYQAIEDLYRISNNNYSDLVKKNIDLNTQLRIMTSNRDKWRAGVMAGVVVTVVYAVIKYNSN